MPLPSLTDEDAQALRFVVEFGDIAAVSFIRTPADVEYVFEVLDRIAAEHEAEGRSDLAQRARDLGIVFKIETIPGFTNLPEIITTALRRENTGLMIARGDLAVEVGFDRMARGAGEDFDSGAGSGHPHDSGYSGVGEYG